jgi:DNA anti-recombination protein RmuC
LRNIEQTVLQTPAENILKQLGVKYIHKQNSPRQKYRKGTNVNNPGQPDFIIFFPKGQCILAEAKMPGEELREDQKRWKKDIEKAGYKYIKYETMEEFIKIVEEYM